MQTGAGAAREDEAFALGHGWVLSEMGNGLSLFGLHVDDKAGWVLSEMGNGLSRKRVTK